jgi:hypothetical protein
MKKLLTILFLFAAILAVKAQDVSIDLQPFTLEIPEVKTLTVRPLGALQKRYNNDSTQVYYLQSIYYELRRDDGRTVEAKNLEIPEQFSDLLIKYQKGILNQEERQIINAYLQGFNERMILKE